MQKVETHPTEDKEMPPERPNKWRRLGRDHFGPLALYLVGALVFTWPLVLNLGNRVINPRATSADVWQHLWNEWWLRFSLLDLHSQPFYSPMIFWPTGANLYFHALDPLDGYISVPLQLLFGLVAAFNLIFFIQLTLAGYAAYWLAHYLTRNYAAALVAGIIYAFSPLESALLNLGQVELTSIAWLPFFLLFFIKTLDNAPRPWLNRVASVLFLLALALDSWYYVLYALLFGGLYLLYCLWRTRQKWQQEWWRTIARFAGVTAVWAVLVSPLLLPTLHEANSGGTRQELWIVAYNSADLLGFIQPGPSAIWGIFGFGPSQEYRGNFLGLFALLLAVVGIVTCWRKSWFWVASGLIFGLLALGPVLHLRFEDWDNKTAVQGLWLPGRLLFDLPFGNIARVPLRFGLGLMLAIAICAAFGLGWLMKRFSLNGSRANLRRALPLVAGGLIFLEFLPIPRTLVDTPVPAFYQQLRNEGKWNDFAVLEMPDKATNLAMYYQTVHQHPILNAYLSRRPVYPFEQTPGIRDLRFLKLDKAQENQIILQRDILDRNAGKNISAVLAYYKIRYVILHPELLKGDEQKAERERADEVLGQAFSDTRPYYQDAELKVWRVPELEPAKPTADKILPGFGAGWGNRENGPNNEARRVIGTQAELSLVNPLQAPLEVEITSNIESLGAARNLQIWLADQKITEQQIDTNPTKISFRLTLKPGLNNLSFRAGGKAENNRSLLFGPLKIT